MVLGLSKYLDGKGREVWGRVGLGVGQGINSQLNRKLEFQFGV